VRSRTGLLSVNRRIPSLDNHNQSEWDRRTGKISRILKQIEKMKSKGDREEGDFLEVIDSHEYWNRQSAVVISFINKLLDKM
jgi:hypothetical protein